MIPQRVKMSGFLSYKDEQAVEFGTAPLWMLAGTNGSGKSSVFDAVTYALFGHHRGGSQNAAELINKESNALSVEFDFKLDGTVYRAKRTIRRNAKGVTSATQQVFQESAGDWTAVRDTNKKVDFDKWVHDHIGLNYETFTSSVLLLQGKAEKLLDARPSGRAEVLAGIVDLERYQRLHEKANGRKLVLKSKLEALGHQQAAVPDVSDLEYATAMLAIDEAEETRTQAQAEVNKFADLEASARRWADARGRLDGSRAKLRHAELLLGEAVKIEKEFARLAELKEVLPAAHTVVSMRGQVKESQAKTDRLTKQREEANERKLRAEHALDQAKKKRASQQKLLADDESKQAKVVARLRELSAVLEKVKLAEDQEAELKRLDDDLAKLPADPDGAVRAANAAADHLTELNRVLPILERFQTERHDLGVAVKAEQAARADQQQVQNEGLAKKAEADQLAAALDRARQARAAADEGAAVTKAMADRAAEAVTEFTALRGAAACKACGQPLTEKHFTDEKRKRDAEAKAANDKYRKATEDRAKAAAREQEASAAAEAIQKQVGDLRDAYKDHQAHARQAAADVKRLTDSLGLRYAELPAEYQAKVARTAAADWTRTTFPERDELVALRREVGGLDGAKRQLQQAQATQAKWHRLRAQAEVARGTLTKLRAGLPGGDPTKLREEHRTLQTDEAALLNAIRAAKSGLMALETEADTLGKDAHSAVQLLTSLRGQLDTEEVNRRHCREAGERAMKNLPAAWVAPVEAAGMTEYGRWKSEFEELTAANTEARHRQLEQARGGLNALRQEAAAIEAEADAHPPEARRPPEEIKALLAAARQGVEDRDKELRDAQRQKAVLDGHREQRAKLGDQFKKTDGEHNRYKILAELLGRDRLQRHLVRRAERQIVDHANSVLDRLSGGQLFLRLVGEDGAGADRALELECSNRVTGGAPINVAFLSGSQRFRVAVSLVLAIGQYASKQHRPIESVIIDEGFGCLDRQGRQVMIQELQNLRGHLHCILLVSHQEEFAEAFADGYRFELQDGATRVSRFVR